MAWTAETLRTERLLLRAVRETDRPVVVALLTDPRVRRFLGGPADLPADFDSSPLGQQSDVWGVQPVEADTIIGTVSITHRRDRPELSYNFLPRVWGAGYAAEACTAVLDRTWATTDDDQVIAVTQVANARSRALLERLGFTEEERFEEFDAEQSLYCIDRAT